MEIVERSTVSCTVLGQWLASQDYDTQAGSWTIPGTASSKILPRRSILPRSIRSNTPIRSQRIHWKHDIHQTGKRKSKSGSKDGGRQIDGSVSHGGTKRSTCTLDKRRATGAASHQDGKGEKTEVRRRGESGPRASTSSHLAR